MRKHVTRKNLKLTKVISKEFSTFRKRQPIIRESQNSKGLQNTFDQESLNCDTTDILILGWIILWGRSGGAVYQTDNSSCRGMELLNGLVYSRTQFSRRGWEPAEIKLDVGSITTGSRMLGSHPVYGGGLLHCRCHDFILCAGGRHARV